MPPTTLNSEEPVKVEKPPATSSFLRFLEGENLYILENVLSEEIQ